MAAEPKLRSEPGGIALRHALIVDDEPQVRSFVAKAVVGAGFVSHEASRIPEVEAALAQYRPDVIILDLALRGEDGIEVMRRLATARFAGRVLLVSGHDVATLKEAHKIGVRRGLEMLEPLHKPFRLEDIRTRLAELDDSRRVGVGNADLETALQHNWLELWYQPKITLKTLAVCGAEALIRMRHPELGIVEPAGFLPPSGHQLYQPLTDFVVRRALADWSTFAAWPSIGEEWANKRLAINVPASVLQTTDFIDNLRRHLPDHPKFPGLIVEITEDEAISDPNFAREVAVQLRLYNVHVSIDDFGTGHSLLARLSELPFVELKLDRSFVNGCAADESKRWTCQTVVELAHRFDLTAVAEGVETLEDIEYLTDIGCDAGQGYYFARPMKSTDFATMLMSYGRPKAHWTND